MCTSQLCQRSSSESQPEKMQAGSQKEAPNTEARRPPRPPSGDQPTNQPEDLNAEQEQNTQTSPIRQWNKVGLMRQCFFVCFSTSVLKYMCSTDQGYYKLGLFERV